MLIAKTILAISGLAALAHADAVHKCESCTQGGSSDCINAFNQIPTMGTLSATKGQQWTSGSCTIEWITDGVSVNAADFHGEAQALVNQCCMNSDQCSDLSYHTGSTNDLESGCVCIHSSDACPCICAGTPTLNCL